MGKRKYILRCLLFFASLLVAACGGSDNRTLFSGPSAVAFISIPVPFQHDFGAVLVESHNEATFTVKNEGVRDATSLTGGFTISAFSYKGGTFPGTGGTCQSTLAPQTSCSIVVVFSPQYADTFAEFIHLNYHNGQHTDLATTVQLLGRGVASAAGTLDTTFHSSGLATLTVGGGITEARQVVSLPDRSMLIAGESKETGQWNMFVLKLNQEGDIDTSFGGTGVAAMDFDGGDDFVSSMLVLNDGSILIGGRAFSGGKYQFAFWRLTPTGMNDTAFGNQGKMTVSVGTQDSEVRAMAQQPDSSVVAVGSASNGTNFDFAAVRLLSNSSLDGSFGTGGKAVVPVGTEDDRATGLALLGDGKIILGGYSDNGANHDMAAVRLLSNGTPDSSYGTGGKSLVDFSGHEDEANTVSLQHDGKVILAGKSGTPSQFAITRLLDDGSIDTGFGSSGRVLVSHSSDPANIFASAIQGDGRILVAGYSSFGSDQNITTTRLLMNGSLDSTFGTAGKAYFPVGSSPDRAYGITIAANSKILIVGETDSPNTQGVIARIWP